MGAAPAAGQGQCTPAPDPSRGDALAAMRRAPTGAARTRRRLPDARAGCEALPLAARRVTWYARVMKVLVVGAAGRTGSHALRLMLAAHQGPVLGMVRRPEQCDAVAAFGAEPVLCDLTTEAPREGETSLDQALDGVDAVLCAAGARDAREAEAVDHRGTVRLVDAARAAGVARFLLVSAMGADRPDRAAPSLRPLLQAKREAERALEASGMAWTVLRPGALTDEPGTGRVRLGESLGDHGSVPRADVARVAVTALRRGAAERRALELLSGDRPIEDALQGL